jgi:hypothetical protein
MARRGSGPEEPAYRICALIAPDIVLFGRDLVLLPAMEFALR